MADKMCNITELDIKNLLEMFAKQDYNPRSADAQSEEVLNRCIELWKLDYDIEIIPNEKGEFCDSYPSRIPIPVAEAVEKNLNTSNSSSIDMRHLSFESEGAMCLDPLPKFATQNRRREKDDKKNIDSKVWKHIISKSNVARCWNRFPVPVLLINGKYISRSATISATIDVGLKSFVGKFTKKSQPEFEEEFVNQSYGSSSESRAVHHIARLDDVRLLKMCEVSSIIDFMVEKKKQKYYLNVSSSEKVDVEKRYKDFSIYSMPYPGCEFFKKFTQRNLNSEDLHHSWNETAWESNEAKMNVPEDTTRSVKADWENYKTWDVRTLTDNYIRVILDLLMNKKEKGLLLHCISGWDRTPLFISLIRLILWGEGTIHENLSSLQMLYFTLGYDWYLFKHKLNTRIGNGEHILYFCFEILSILSIDKIMMPRSRSVSVGSQGSSFEFLNLSNVHDNNTNEETPLSPLISKPVDDFYDNNTNEETTLSITPIPSDEVTSLYGTIHNEHWPFRQPQPNGVSCPEEKQSRIIDPEELITAYRNSFRKGDFEDRDLGFFERSLSPPAKRPIATTTNSPKSPPFFGRQAANRFLEFNDPLSSRLHPESESQMDTDKKVYMPTISSPLPVPGCDIANESFVNSWNYVTKDASIRGSSWEGFIKKKDGGIYEKSIGSSLGSASSFIAYDKQKRLTKVRLLFYKLFGEVAALNKTS